MKSRLRFLVATGLVAVAASLAGPAHAAGPVTITIKDGLVSVQATEATPRQILAEWARVGRIAVTNLERIPGSPMTLELRDVPESKALDVVLRGIGGYMAAPRAVPDAALSRYDRILVMPVVAGATPVATTASAPPPAAQPNFGRGLGGVPQMGPATMRLMGRRPDPNIPEDAEAIAEQELYEQKMAELNRQVSGGRQPQVADEPAQAEPQTEPAVIMQAKPSPTAPGAGAVRPGLTPPPPLPSKPPGR